MTHYLRESLAVTTCSAYSSATRSFIRFAIHYNRLHHYGQLLPESEETLMLFATYLAPSQKPQSIKLYLYAVRNLHLEHGQPDPLTDATNLRRLLRGIKRMKGTAPDSRLPITPCILRAFARHLHTTFYDHSMLWAALLTAFIGFLWSKELLALQHADISRGSNHYQLHLRGSKTDPFRHGAMVTVTASADYNLCAVQALDRLLSITQRRQGPLFNLQSGAPLSRERLNKLIHVLAAGCGLPERRYSSHSFRIGAATTAAAAGVPDWRIQALGRWSSDCYQRYIRAIPEETNSVAELMVQVHL